MSQPILIGSLIVTHGQLAREFVSTAEMIVGDFSHIIAVTIGWHEELDAAKREIRNALRVADQGRGVLILTDMFGGTPSNISIPFLEKGHVDIVTGVNLAMVVKVASQDGSESLEQLAASVKEQGQKNISAAGELLGE